MYRPVAPPGGVPEGRGKEGKDRAREGGAAPEGGMALTSGPTSLRNACSRTFPNFAILRSKNHFFLA